MQRALHNRKIVRIIKLDCLKLSLRNWRLIWSNPKFKPHRII